MPFRPNAHDTFNIDGVAYSIAEHPFAPGMPYGQEGRAATVYQLLAPATGEERAIKVFKPKYSVPAMSILAERLKPFAALPGLQVCSRTVLTPGRHRQLLKEHEDLTYAVMMPWIEGPTWMEVLLGEQTLYPEQSLHLARSLTDTLGQMEERGVAHCDLSGPNLLISALASGAPADVYPIELVDVEQLYAPGFERPDFVPAGSSGYASHRTASQLLWEPKADRFAGAILISEILGWCDERVHAAAYGETYFDPDEMQRESERYNILVTVLRDRWGERVSRLLERAWESETLADCPTFGKWSVALPDHVPSQAPVLFAPPPAPTGDAPNIPPTDVSGHTITVRATPPDATDADIVRTLMKEASRLEEHGDLAGALSIYREAYSLAPTQSSIAAELSLVISYLETVQQAVISARDAQADELEIAHLFDDGFVAEQMGEWTQARELLAEVVRRHPDYERSGRKAATLLATTEAQIASARSVPGTENDSGAPQAASESVTLPNGQAKATINEHATVQIRPKRSPSRAMVPILVIVMLLAFGAMTLAVLQMQEQERQALAAARATATTQAEATRQILMQAATSQAVQTKVAQATQTAQTQQALNATTTAQAKETSVAQAQAVQSATAQAQAEQSATAQAQVQQIAQATAQAEEQARATAIAVPPRILSGHATRVVSVAFSADRQTLASGSYEEIKLWRISDGAELRTLKFDTFMVAGPVFSPNGQVFASGVEEGKIATIKIGRLSDGAELHTLRGPEYNKGNLDTKVTSLAYSWDGQTLAAGFSYLPREGGSYADVSTIKLWRASDGAELRTWDYSGEAHSLAFSPDGKSIAANDHEKIRLWKIPDGIGLGTLTAFASQESLAYSPDGSILASVDVFGTVMLWNVSDGTLIRTLKGLDRLAGGYSYASHGDTVAFSPDGKSIAACPVLSAGSKAIKLWRISDGQEIRSLPGHIAEVVSLAFSPDGQTLASGSWDNTIRLWKVK